METLPEAKLIKNLSTGFHSKFRETVRQKVYSDEQLVYAADVSANILKSVYYGFMIFTNRRYLQVMAGTDQLGTNTYFQSGSNWRGQSTVFRSWMGNQKVLDDEKLFLSQHKRLAWNEDEEYSRIKGIIRNDYLAHEKTKSTPLVELRLEFYERYGEWYITFKAADGAFICDLLNLAKQNGGKIPLQPTDTKEDNGTEVTRLMNALAELHKSGLLTAEEFAQKKQELLSRI